MGVLAMIVVCLVVAFMAGTVPDRYGRTPPQTKPKEEEKENTEAN